MKRIFTIFAVVLLNAVVFAQSPQKMSYQAVIRNSSNELVTSTTIGMQISILQGSGSGLPVYIETQTPTTNVNGLGTMEIGAGVVSLGNFSLIDWTNGPYFIRIETDLLGGTNYTITGTSQLLSVPYALYAQKSGNGDTWLINGNLGTAVGTNFLGTTDQQPLMFKVNNKKSGYIDFDNTKANTGFGFQSLNSNTAGDNNTANGDNALYSNTSGDANTAIGSWALQYNTTGSYNIANGFSALNLNTVGNNNIATGAEALSNNTIGNNNVAIGGKTMRNNTTGNYNTANGFETLYSNTTGSYNTASGISALYSNTSGDNNTAYGYAALNFNTTGTYNTAIGQQALYHNTIGTNNTAIGLSALGYNTIGANNTAIGESALLNSTGSENVAIGNNALLTNSTGDKNTALGTNAFMPGTLTNTTLIGYGATATASNIIRLGNTDVTDVSTAGTYTAGTVTYPNTIGNAGEVLTLPANGGIAYWATPASGGSRMQPFLTINYIIATQGSFPSDGGSDPGTTLIGEIKMFAGNFAPAGWAFCDGQLLSIASNSALFSVLGNTYGGNGTTNFMLPDMRGRVSIHEGQGSGLTNKPLGSSGGSE